MTLRLTCSILLSLAISGLGAVPDFSRDILPILSENCFHCHGQDAKARKADLRLDVESEAKKVTEGAAPIFPGKASASSILQRMHSTDEDEVMPPPKSNRSVSPQQREMIRQWIDAGAPWGEHWAFTPVKKPSVPTVPGARSAIDAFVQEKQAQHGLQPSPPAPPSTLLRRVTLDLTGLPPTPQELATFTTQPQSYAQQVDRLLASPEFGQKWVWDWLDASRYADTNGYQGDNDRTAWPWRDWVIQSINQNLRYDDFTLWQIAGDLLPAATQEQKLATAFVRNHMINGEGGRIPEENRVEYLFDQTETVGTLWLGLTLQCSRCHDHKFDPLTQQDYYSMLAFFNGTPVDGQGRGGQTAPVLDMSTPAEKARADAASARVVAVGKEVEAFELKKFPRPAGKSLGEGEAAKLPGNLPATLAKVAPAKRSVDGTLEAIGYFKGKDDAYVKVLQKLTQALRERTTATANITRVMVMQERPEGVRETPILDRGAYDAPTEKKATPATPAKLPAMHAGLPKNRLGLAQWIIDRENPLTARVTVNRFWQALFGIGLVKTAEDFGVQGERPQHMDLLDWLAADFMESGWDVKHLLRQILLSQTYQQSSRITGGAEQRDPENRLLARGPRFRLPSHTLRDQALAASGLLSQKSGGPAVRSYQPEGIWEEATFGKIAYKPDQGEPLYRRSLYTFWRRIVGPTMFFDTAQRQTCAVKQTRTNTPLHALVTLNETTYVESARVLAQQLLMGPQQDSPRFNQLYLRVLSRLPVEQERSILSATLETLRAKFSASPADALKLLTVGDMPRDETLPAPEHAAWASLCLMVLNLDEAVTKE